MEAHNPSIQQDEQYENLLKQLLRPPPQPIVATTSHIIPPNAKIHAKFRNMKPYNGFEYYAIACGEQARIHGLNLPSNRIRIVATILWKKEPSSIRNAYISDARDASLIIRKHKAQFLPEAEHHKCSEKCDNS